MAGKKPNWPAIEADYLAGLKPRELSRKYGVPPKTISNRASAHGWGKAREETGKKIAAGLPEAIAARVIGEAADYVEQHTGDWQELRRLIFSGLKPEATDDDRKRAALAIEAAKAYKLVQAGQRLSLGLDKEKPVEAHQGGVIELPAIVPPPDPPPVEECQADG